MFIQISSIQVKNGEAPEIVDVYNNEIVHILEKNNFKTVALFDNHDYDYDPTDYISTPKIHYFFKRNYCKDKVYKHNVFPFSFIIFGPNAFDSVKFLPYLMWIMSKFRL